MATLLSPYSQAQRHVPQADELSLGEIGS